MSKALNKYNRIEWAEDIPEASILEAVQQYQRGIECEVRQQIKEKLKDLSLDEVIKKVRAETKSTYKAAAKKKIADVLEDAWA